MSASWVNHGSPPFLLSFLHLFSLWISSHFDSSYFLYCDFRDSLKILEWFCFVNIKKKCCKYTLALAYLTFVLYRWMKHEINSRPVLFCYGIRLRILQLTIKSASFIVTISIIQYSSSKSVQTFSNYWDVSSIVFDLKLKDNFAFNTNIVFNFGLGCTWIRSFLPSKLPICPAFVKFTKSVFNTVSELLCCSQDDN